MKKWWVIVPIVVLLLAVLTVPKQADYSDWLKNEFKKKAGNPIASFAADTLGDKLIDSFTSCNSYGVALYCKTEVTDKAQIRAVGMFRMFIPLKTE